MDNTSCKIDNEYVFLKIYSKIIKLPNFREYNEKKFNLKNANAW